MPLYGPNLLGSDLFAHPKYEMEREAIRTQGRIQALACLSINKARKEP